MLRRQNRATLRAWKRRVIALFPSEGTNIINRGDHLQRESCKKPWASTRSTWWQLKRSSNRKSFSRKSSLTKTTSLISGEALFKDWIRICSKIWIKLSVRSIWVEFKRLNRSGEQARNPFINSIKRMKSGKLNSKWKIKHCWSRSKRSKNNKERNQLIPKTFQSTLEPRVNFSILIKVYLQKGEI